MLTLTTTNGGAEGKTPIGKQDSQETAVDLPPVERLADMIEKRVRNLEKRKAKLDVFAKEVLKGKAIHREQQEALDKLEEVVIQLETLKELAEQTNKLVKESAKTEKKEKERMRRQTHADGVERHARIMRLQRVAMTVEHGAFVKAATVSADLDAHHADFLAHVLAMFATLTDAARVTANARTLHLLFDGVDTVATSAKLPVFDTCKQVSVKQGREFIAKLFADGGVMSTTAVDGAIAVTTVNGQATSVGNSVVSSSASVSPVARTPTPPVVGTYAAAAPMPDTGIVYAHQLEQQYSLDHQVPTGKPLSVPSPPPPIPMPGDTVLKTAVGGGEHESPIDATSRQPQFRRGTHRNANFRRTPRGDGDAVVGGVRADQQPHVSPSDEQARRPPRQQSYRREGDVTGAPAIPSDVIGGGGHVEQYGQQQQQQRGAYNNNCNNGRRPYQQQQQRRPQREGEEGWQTQQRRQDKRVVGSAAVVGAPVANGDRHGSRQQQHVPPTVIYDERAAKTQPAGW